MEYRIERDSLGEVKVPAQALYGAQTMRAVENFPVSGQTLPPAFTKAQAAIKLAAAQANMAVGGLEAKLGNALIAAAEAIFAGTHNDQFVVDVFQAGAGTSQNMNINEVLANLANGILGGERGVYDPIHPNDHANMAQSTNDTIHAAIHIASVCEIHQQLLPAIAALHDALENKAHAFDHIIKCGRTHLQDAAPVRLGQEFGAYAQMMRLGQERIEVAAKGLLPLCIGGTAVGTGLNTAPGYRKHIIDGINQATGHKFTPAENLFEAMQSMDAIVSAAGALRVLATGLRKMADDLRLMSSGPRAGLIEIRLPAVQPGSSIMPGKVNPVMPEMLNMVCLQCLGCDATIIAAAQSGQLELNVMMPVIAHNLLHEIAIITGGIKAFTEKCVIGIEANEDICKRAAERSSSLATALNPVLGYDRAARLAKEALDTNKSIRELVQEKDLLDKDTMEQLFDADRMTRNPDESSKE